MAVAMAALLWKRLERIQSSEDKRDTDILSFS
jgi:hypothetical protein